MYMSTIRYIIIYFTNINMMMIDKNQLIMHTG